jgi:TRAP-type mannitol/chloroaromatic compound transport system substrate-binding protein
MQGRIHWYQGGKQLFNKFLTLAAVGLVGAVALGAAGDAEAQKVRWKMQSAFGSKLSIIGEVAARYEDIVKDMSAGDLNIKFYEPGALVPTLQGFDAVEAGSVDAMWGTAGYHTGKYPALSFFTAVPFGPRAGELLAWMGYGGGDELYNELYEKHDLIGLHCAAIAPETSGWFRSRLNSIDDLKGKKMRFFGLGAKVMTKLGVSTQLLAGADIYPALERGVIDATEFSMPSIDLDLGFYQIAKFNYFPGWHQQSSIGELLMRKSAFEALSGQHQAIIRHGCDASITWSFVRSEAKQFEAMLTLQEKGVESVRWSDDDIAKLAKAWEEVVAEEIAADPNFAKFHASYQAFRDKYAIWKEHGYLD